MPLTIFTVGWAVVFFLNRRNWEGVKGIPKNWLIALGVCITLDIIFNL